MPPRGGRSAALAAALAVGAGTLGCDSLLAPGACTAPMVSGAAVMGNPTNVLAAFATAHVRGADSVLVRFGVNAALDSATPAFPVSGDSLIAPVLGLSAETTYQARVVAFNRCGSAAGELLPFATGALPPDLPAYAAGGPAPSPGYVVFAAGNYGLVIDNSGRVVWYHRFPNGPGLNFQPQPNGRYAARPSPEAGKFATWLEIAPDGSLARTLGCARGLQPRMHDLIAQPDGSYWLLCDETRTVDLSAQGGVPHARVLGTAVQRRDAAGGVLFEWSAFDHLDVDLGVLEPADRAGPAINWTHGNALDLDGDGNLLVSFRNLSEVTKISTRTGAVVWRMGGARNQFAFENLEHVAGGPAFARQHGVRATGGAELLLLDNLGGPGASRAQRYAVNAARRGARLSSSSVSSPAVVAQTGGSTQPLPGGRTLVSYGSGGAVEEYDAAGRVVWRLAGNPGYVFRAQRIRSLYRPGVGDPR